MRANSTGSSIFFDLCRAHDNAVARLQLVNPAEQGIERNRFEPHFRSRMALGLYARQRVVALSAPVMGWLAGL